MTHFTSLPRADEQSVVISARTVPVVDRTIAPVLAVAIVVLLARMTLAILLIPAWQQPDEPIHVAAAEVWRSRITGTDAGDRGREAEIIRSMIRHSWWRHYQQPLPPGPPPTRFVETGAVFSTIGLVPESSSYAPPYYASVGWLLSLGLRTTVEHDLYVTRMVSMLFAVGTLWVAYLGSRLALDELSAATVTSLLALHPQFAIVSTTAAPDAVVNFAGALLWWQTMSAMRGAHVVWSLAVLWLAAIAAAMVDPMGIVLIPVAFVATVAAAMKRLRFRWAAAVLVMAVLGIVVAVWTIPAIRNPLQISMRAALVPASFAEGLEYAEGFTTFLFESWWYSLGWVRYFAPHWWVVGATVVTVVAITGTVRGFARSADTRRVILLAVLNLACLLAALAWVFLRVRIGAQGRYLFPAIVPTLTLMWLGTAAWLPARLRHIGSIGLVAAFAVLDVIALIVVAVPAYL